MEYLAEDKCGAGEVNKIELDRFLTGGELARERGLSERVDEDEGLRFEY